jgi:hypothetical protein
LTLTVASRRPAILKGGLEAAYFSRCGVVDLTLICHQQLVTLRHAVCGDV